MIRPQWACALAKAYRLSRWGLAAFILCLAAGLGAPRRSWAEDAPQPTSVRRAVVTFGEGETCVIGARGRHAKISVGDELLEGERISLGESASLTVLWDHGETMALRGPENGLTLKPTQPPPEGGLQKLISIARNVWQAVRSRLKQAAQGRSQPAIRTEEPLAVRGPSRLYPANERARPGQLTLLWDAGSTAGSYVVMVWDSGGQNIWKTKTEVTEAPVLAALEPSRRYWWLVMGAEDCTAWTPLCWFEILSSEEAQMLGRDVDRAREMFKTAQPPSQLHLALGCVLESYGLASEAREEYRKAATLSPGIPAYQALVRQVGTATSAKAETGEESSEAPHD